MFSINEWSSKGGLVVSYIK